MHLNRYAYRTWGLEDKNVRETWGRANVPHVPSTLYTSAFERFYVSMWGTFSIPWFSVSKLLENRNHLRFASATGGRPFRFLLATRPHVAEGASASFGACLCFLRATSWSLRAASQTLTWVIYPKEIWNTLGVFPITPRVLDNNPDFWWS